MREFTADAEPAQFHESTINLDQYQLPEAILPGASQRHPVELSESSEGEIGAIRGWRTRFVAVADSGMLSSGDSDAQSVAWRG